MESVRNTIDAKLVSSENYLQWTLKPRYLSQKSLIMDLLRYEKAKLH